MTSRLIITGTNATLPDDAAQSCEGQIGSRYAVCPDCSGDGWVYGWGNNPSDKPFQADCRYCNGEGVIPRKNKVSAAPPSRDKAARSVALPFNVERAAPTYDLTAGRWIVPPPGMTPEAVASAEPMRTQDRTRTKLSSLTDPSPVANPTAAAGRLDAALDFVVTVLGLTVFGLIASFFLVLS